VRGDGILIIISMQHDDRIRFATVMVATGRITGATQIARFRLRAPHLTGNRIPSDNTSLCPKRQWIGVNRVLGTQWG